MRDHGGDLDRAIKRHGGGGWLDLSTGINPVPYPLPEVPQAAWAALPTAGMLTALEQSAATAYDAGAEVVALAGAQAAIQLAPRLSPPGRAAVVGPTYNEHAAALCAQGWEVREVAAPDAAAGSDLAVVVNPNNPDGRSWTPETLLALRRRVARLVVDESFADVRPALSLASHVARDDDGLLVLRSFGKFYGLAGLRLGFVVTGARSAERLRALAGPWAVNGPAAFIGRAALTDTSWREATRARLERDAARLDALAEATGWRPVGGTPLFRTYETGDAVAAQNRLAQGRVWSRIFPYSPGWLRLGLPGDDAGWAQLSAALGSAPEP